MAKECRHIHHSVQPQSNRWKGGEFKGIDPGQVFCADPPRGCGQWLYEKPINWDLVPKNAIQRREARIDDSRSGRASAQSASGADSQRRTHAG